MIRKKSPPAGENAPVTGEGLQKIFSDCCDFECRRVDIGGDKSRQTALCFIDGLVGGVYVAEEIIRPLTDGRRFPSGMDMSAAAEQMMGGLAYGCTARERTGLEEVAQDLLNGFCAVVLGEGLAVTFEMKSPQRRQVSEPKEEKVVKGSKDAFVETIRVNTSLVRRKIRDKRLKIRQMTLGEKSGTMVSVVYIDGFTNKEMVEETCRRLGDIRCEGVITTAVIEENICDDPRTPFPQLISTERPDKFALNILEGRVGILVDGLPLGYLAPGTFSQFMKVPEDESEHFIVASAITVLRYISFFITLLLPGFYVAVAMYHQEMIPTKLMQSMIEAKQSVPFPTAVEVLMMLVAFELLQEAGLRLPSPIGMTVSIIGALIVGQSAVEARVVSPVVVVVIALAGIAGYTMPNQDMASALRLFRFLLTLTAILLGMFGLAVGSALILYHLSGLESFGVPYMTPFAGARGRYMGRALLRKSMRVRRERDPLLGTEEGEER